MIYAQFYQKAAWPAGQEKPIEAIGDRSVIILDGRLSIIRNIEIAGNECRARGYYGFAIFRSDNFQRPNSTVVGFTEIAPEGTTTTNLPVTQDRS